MPLTPRQQKFIEVYEGNGTEAARLAGYKGNDNVLGVTAHELLKIPKIADAIRSRTQEANAPLIASRQDRQAFWTAVQNDSTQDLTHRLRASELLGKSEADFVDRHEMSGALNIYLTPLPDGEK